MDSTTELKRCPEQKSVETEPVHKKMKFEQSKNQSHMCPEFSHDSEVLRTFKSNLKEKCERTLYQRNSTLLNEIYTDLYISENENAVINSKRRVRHKSRKPPTEETQIKYKDIFKPLPEQDKHIRSVMTKGVGGIGKTVSVQKFILDWTEEKENQDVHLIFPLPFRELNLMKNKTLSLLDLLHLFFPETKEIEILSDKYKVLFILDGLDECHLSLSFNSNVMCDVSKPTLVDVILVNLIKGNLFPSSFIWITTRPAAADIIPSKWIDRVTEIRGFSDTQIEEYFRKRISYESLFDQIISHVTSSGSLYIMCHIPVFCWISVTVLERFFSKSRTMEIPNTLTQMYTHFLILQTNVKHQKDYEKKVKDEEIIFKLGKLAFEQLLKGNLIFFDEDLKVCDIDVSEASLYSELCAQIFREEFGLDQRKVYSFVHLSIQEHLAALYAHISAVNNNENVLIKLTQSPINTLVILDLYRRVIDEALRSKNGHLDLFLRFLLGLSQETNQSLLEGLGIQKVRSPNCKTKTIKYIKNKLRLDLSLEKNINLFHCLNELGDQPVVVQIRNYLTSALSKSKLTSSQSLALVMLMLPAICESKTVELSRCNITDESCVYLTSALRSNPSNLRELNLSDNNFRDSGLKLISDVLKNPQCKLEKLRLRHCNITAEGCVSLTSALRSNPSHLKVLSLSNNNFGDSGMELVSGLLEDPRCEIESLLLCGCNITDEGCFALSSALTSNPSHLKELNLSGNKFGDLGVKLISAILENPQCKLENLKMLNCNITDEGCFALASALTSNPSSQLKIISLKENKVEDLGVGLFSDLIQDPHYTLQILHV